MIWIRKKASYLVLCKCTVEVENHRQIDFITLSMFARNAWRMGSSIFPNPGLTFFFGKKSELLDSSRPGQDLAGEYRPYVPRFALVSAFLLVR